MKPLKVAMKCITIVLVMMNVLSVPMEVLVAHADTEVVKQTFDLKSERETTGFNSIEGIKFSDSPGSLKLTKDELKVVFIHLNLSTDESFMGRVVGEEITEDKTYKVVLSDKAISEIDNYHRLMNSGKISSVNEYAKKEKPDIYYMTILIMLSLTLLSMMATLSLFTDVIKYFTIQYRYMEAKRNGKI